MTLFLIQMKLVHNFYWVSQHNEDCAVHFKSYAEITDVLGKQLTHTFLILFATLPCRIRHELCPFEHLQDIFKPECLIAPLQIVAGITASIVETVYGTGTSQTFPARDG